MNHHYLLRKIKASILSVLLDNTHSHFVRSCPVPGAGPLLDFCCVRSIHYVLCERPPHWVGGDIGKEGRRDVMKFDLSTDEACYVGVVGFLVWVQVRAKCHKRVQ